MSNDNILGQNNSNNLENIIDQLAKYIVDYTFNKINQFIYVNLNNNKDYGKYNSLNLDNKSNYSKNKNVINNIKSNKLKKESKSKFNLKNNKEDFLSKNKKEIEEYKIKARKNRIFN